MIVADDFAKLINMQRGTRPLRTISGLDFGVVGAINKTTEKYRQSFLKEMGLVEMDTIAGT